MLDWEDEVELSAVERRRIKQLATSELDRTLVQLSRTRATLEALPSGDPEHVALLARVEAEQKRTEALRHERLERISQALREPAGIVPVDMRAVEESLTFEDCKVIRRNGTVVSFDPSRIAFAVTKVFLFFANGRTKAVLKSFYCRQRAERRIRGRVRKLGQLVIRRVRTRSVASRSRMTAPIAAPPSIS